MASVAITVEDSERGERKTYVFDRSPVLIGRGEGMNLVLSRPAVAPAHGMVAFGGGKLTYTDLDGGTLLDGKKVRPRVETTVRPGAHLEIGPLRLWLDPTVAGDGAAETSASGGSASDGGAHATRTLHGAGGPAGDAVPEKRPTPGGDPRLELAPTLLATPRSPTPPTVKADDAAPDAVPVRGSRLGKYEILELIGRGGMGSVFRAQHVDLKKEFALKTLSATLALVPASRARFLREAEAASRIRHPHVVDVTDFGEERGVYFLVMELLRGEDLAVSLERGAFTVERTADVMLAVCAAVHAAHSEGVVHRDLKPRNVFLSRTPVGDIVPKVLDFGVSRLLDAGTALTSSGDIVGSIHYLAPEQLSGGAATPASDQHGLGVMAYICLTGQKPYSGDSPQDVIRAIAVGQAPPPRTLRGEIPPALEAIVLRAMSPRPESRFGSVHELGVALLPFASPKRRIMWADHFVAGPEPIAPAKTVPLSTMSPPLGPASVPGPADPARPSPGGLMPRPVDPNAETRTSMPAAGGSAVPKAVVKAVPLSEPTGAIQLPRNRSAKVWIAGLGALVVAGVAILFATRGEPPRVEPVPAPAPAVAAAPAAPVAMPSPVAVLPTPVPTAAEAAPPAAADDKTDDKAEKKKSRRHRSRRSSRSVKFSKKGVPILR